VLLGLVGAGMLDRVLLAHTTVLTLAYLPGRTVPLPGWVAHTFDAGRSVVTPVVVAGLLWVVCRPGRDGSGRLHRPEDHPIAG
jgi:hypothetical protein